MGSEFQAVCQFSALPVGRGVAALVHGKAVAIFRLADGQVRAVGNHDPFSRTSVLARGIIGRRGDIDFVALPAHRRSFDLATGVCLQDASFSVPCFDVLVEDDTVFIGSRRGRSGRRAG